MNQVTQADDLTVNAENAAVGDMGQKLLISGDAIALRMWDEQPDDGEAKSAAERSYEVVGYVLEGRAELVIADKTISLKPGDSWVVPKHTEHSYRVLEHFRAVEATSPPARGYSSGK